jgi:uncharacterized membrane protein HdeD (DUF308 family)
MADTAVEGVVGNDVRDVLVAIGRHWGWVLTFGILSVLLGICLLVWPSASVVVIATFLGAYLLVSGIFQVVNGFALSELSTGFRWLIGISGFLSILLGLYAFRSIAHSVTILVLLIGFAWLLRGFTQLFDAIGAKGMPGRGWAITTGILGIIAGLVVLMYPGPSLWALTLISGIWLIVLGIAEIVGAFRLRSLGQSAATA